MFFVFAISVLHHKSWNKLPTGVHLWPQSDHYNLSLGFLDNEFDFFHPKTYSLTHEFPPKKELKDPKGITAVDFPILHYSVAGLMYIIGDTSPWVFRFVSLFWSFIALWFLFDTVREMKGIGIALFLCGFVMFQPIYCYYQNGFHVSSAAFNTLLLGICFMLKHFSNGKYSLFLYGVCLMTLAALMRFTHIISLLAFGGMCIVLAIRNKKWDNRIWLIIIGVTIVIGYFIYNQYLAINFGSIWLNKPVISNSIGELFEQILGIGIRYSKFFLPPFHLIILVSIVALGIKNYRLGVDNFNEMLIWIVFLIIGASSFTLLMTPMVRDHEYYSLDVWMPVLIIILLFFIRNLDEGIIYSHKWKKIGITLLICTFSFAVFIQERRYGLHVEESNGDVIINNFNDSSIFLDSIIPKNAKVLIICGGGWNTPMVGWRRNVSRVASKYSQRIPYELSVDYDFIVTHDLSFQNITLNNYPNYFNAVHKLEGNGLVTVWKQF